LFRWLVLIIVIVVGAGGWVVSQRVSHPLAAPVLLAGLPSSLTVPGPGPPLPWPAVGQGAVSIPTLRYAAQSGPEAPVPIASLTKMTSALVVLRDHPLAPGASGPAITITAADVAEYDSEVHNDQSTIPVQLGEVLTERQMLEAMLTQSANNIAYSLALWDAGSLSVFVGEMNALAMSLGATSSHYVDVSGYDPGSVSTAADCLRIAAAGMSNPTFAQVVGLSSITLPLMGTRPNIVSEIGSDNVVGVKSGYTSEAKGCMVLAANRTVGGRQVQVLVAVLGQPVPPPITPNSTTTTAPPPTTAPLPPTSTPPTPTTPTTPTTTIPKDDLEVPDPFRYTRPVIATLLNATEAAIVPVTAAVPGQPVGTVTANWGGTHHRVEVITSGGALLLGWPGQRVVTATKLQTVPPGGGVGTRVGTGLFALGSQIEVVPLRLAATVPEPSWWWRLVHN
jgi:D-alanyl-D-alanine carboxypeptidase